MSSFWLSKVRQTHFLCFHLSPQMRKALVCLGSDMSTLSRICAFTRVIYEGILLFNRNASSREISKKTEVLKASLCKIEDACYIFAVRGSEMSTERLLQSFNDCDGLAAGNDGILDDD